MGHSSSGALAQGSALQQAHVPAQSPWAKGWLGTHMQKTSPFPSSGCFVLTALGPDMAVSSMLLGLSGCMQPPLLILHSTVRSTPLQSLVRQYSQHDFVGSHE